MTDSVEIQKNTREVIRVSRAEFKGHDVVNVRVFYDAGDGEMKPGKQGVAFRSALLPELMQALSTIAVTEEAA